jgi:hypothetical protein
VAAHHQNQIYGWLALLAISAKTPKSRALIHKRGMKLASFTLVSIHGKRILLGQPMAYGSLV